MFVEHRCADFGMAADKNKVSVHSGGASLQVSLTSCGPAVRHTRLMKSFQDTLKHFQAWGPGIAEVPLEKHCWGLQVPHSTLSTDEGMWVHYSYLVQGDSGPAPRAPVWVHSSRWYRMTNLEGELRIFFDCVLVCLGTRDP